MTQTGSGQYKRALRVSYPAGRGDLVLRTESDWERDLFPTAMSDDGSTATFEIESQRLFLHFKPCLIGNGKLHWAKGSNNLLTMAEQTDRVVYPYFFGEERGRFSPLVEIQSSILGRNHRLRIYVPPGYEENTLAYYPVAYMQDGQNLFFPEEAFRGQEWRVDETSQILRAMRAVEDLIIVGVYSDDRRNDEYTKPGYESYARSIVEEIIPAEQLFLRGTKLPSDRAMWGSSLGGVVSFYTAWQYPDVFGGAICMSSTFSYKDDLLERVLNEPKRNLRFYLDSGWPNDNYEATIAMALALITRGWRYGHDLLYLCFPNAAHDEKAWGVRLHLPMQLFAGIVARASRSAGRVGLA